MNLNGKKKSSFLSEQERTFYLKEIIAFFQDERSESIGFVAAGKALDFFVEKIGKDLYKRGVKDAKNIIQTKLEDLEVDLNFLSEK